MIQRVQRTVDVPLVQYIDTIVGVPAAKQHEVHDKVQRNRDGQEAAFCPDQDREQEADCLRQWESERLAFRKSLQAGEPRCALCDNDYISEDGCSQTKPMFVSWRSLRAIPQERVEQRTVEHNIDVPVPGACPRVNRRTDRRCACAAVDSERDRRSDEVVPVPQVVEEIAEVVKTFPRSASRSVSPTESSMCQVVKQRRTLPI